MREFIHVGLAVVAAVFGLATVGVLFFLYLGWFMRLVGLIT